MQDQYDFDKTLIANLSENLGTIKELERPFEYDEKELRSGIIALKEAYNKREYDHAKTIRKSIDLLIEKLEKKAELSCQKVRLGKELKKYGILVNVGKMLSGPELDKLLENIENIQYNSEQFEEGEILELREEDIIDDSMMQRKEGSYEKHLYNPKHSGELLDVTIQNLKGKFTRSDLYGKLKQLRKDYYKKGKLNKEGVKELEELLEEAKKERMEFKDVEYSLDLFKKNIRKK